MLKFDCHLMRQEEKQKRDVYAGNKCLLVKEIVKQALKSEGSYEWEQHGSIESHIDNESY